ncbi:MAG: urate oxidase [Gemmatimonadales bacterium]|nr:urate oxidase [Gemmatimonadales bacterium]MBA3555132.1 urate oxidase [Gemmatimonadales bacterium]
MSSRLVWNGYGKAAVRLVKVDRGAARHELHDLTVEVQLQGEFGPAHTEGDNTQVLPTDTMKNTVYALARRGPVDPPEEFGERLARHFLGACPAAHRAVITLAVHRWDRVSAARAPQQHAFVRGPAERRLATVTVEGRGASVEAGIEGLGLLRTSGSAFAGFLRDGYTTLKDTSDRIMATDVEARWKYTRPPRDYGAAWTMVRNTLAETFAGHQSASVQHTLYAMGEAALAGCAEIGEIRLVLPNRHHLLVDLTPFGLENPNEIFGATEEPYGRIEAVIGRN